MPIMLNKIPKQVRYLISSGLNWLVDFLAFVALFQLVGIPAAIFCSRVIGGVFSFATHKWLSFKSTTKPTPREVVGFVGLWLTNYAIVTILVVATPGGTNVLVLAAKFSVEFVVFAANYLFLNKLFIPKRPATIV